MTTRERVSLVALVTGVAGGLAAILVGVIIAEQREIVRYIADVQARVRVLESMHKPEHEHTRRLTLPGRVTP